MSLPEGFSTSEEYFMEALGFLKDFSWIYEYPNTHILVESILNRIPSAWIAHFKGLSNGEFNRFSLDHDSHNISNCPDTLKQFLAKIESLDGEKIEANNANVKPNDSKAFLHYTLPKDFNKKGLSLKKQHEIERLVPLIDFHCKKHNINIVIDIGSGLGYLSQLLFRCGNYKVLGIEADSNKLSAACKRQCDFFPDSSSNVKYIQHFVTDGSGPEILRLLKESFTIEDSLLHTFNSSSSEENIKICLTGLHACADLSISIIKVFAEIDEIACMVAMPCCYHRMIVKQPLFSETKTVETSEKNNEANVRVETSCEGMYDEIFHNFPTSECLKRAYAQKQGESFLKRPFLRLACQQTRGTWRKTTYLQHLKHAEDATRRAILQIVAEKENYCLSRIKRKTKLKQPLTLTSTKHDEKEVEQDSFEMYLKVLETTHCLYPKSATSTNVEATASSTSATSSSLKGPSEIRTSNQAVPVENEQQEQTLPKDNLVNSDRFKQRMRKEWSLVKGSVFHTEYLSLLQVLLQSLCENVILLDRIELLKELCPMNTILNNVEYVKVTDDTLSPRCRALVACKTDGTC